MVVATDLYDEHMSGTVRAAFAYWEGRIAPVFDTATRVLVVETQSGRIGVQTEEALPEAASIQKVLRLAELDIEILVCGAISRQMQTLVAGYGIRVIAFRAGNLCDVLSAWVNNTLTGCDFAMPGCGGRHDREIETEPPGMIRKSSEEEK